MNYDEDIKRRKKKKTEKLKNTKESLSLYESNNKNILSIKNKKLLKDKKNKMKIQKMKNKYDKDDGTIKHKKGNKIISSDDKFDEDITNLYMKKSKKCMKDTMVKKKKKKMKNQNYEKDKNYIGVVMDEDEIIIDNEERIIENVNNVENDHVPYTNDSDKSDEEYSSVNFMKFLKNCNDNEREVNKKKKKKKKSTDGNHKNDDHNDDNDDDNDDDDNDDDNNDDDNNDDNDDDNNDDDNNDDDNNDDNDDDNIKKKLVHSGDQDDHHVDDDSSSVQDSYQYYALKDDMYKLSNENKEKIEFADLMYSNNNFFGQGLQKDLDFLENEQNKKKGKKRLSFIEEQKFNTTLGYVQNVKLLNKMNKAYNVIQNSSKVEFGRQKEKRGNQGEDFVNKRLVKRFLKRKEKIQPEMYDGHEESGYIDDNDDNIINNNILKRHKVDQTHLNGYGEQNEVYNKKEKKIIKREHKKEEDFTIYNFEEEIKMNLLKSKMLHISEDLLKNEKEKKRDELKKIAQLKLLLSIENRKNYYKKKIKSKSYRKYLRIKEKKEEEKIMKKLYSEHPDLVKDLMNYEKEYAEKRNLLNNIKKRKTIKTLNRYKNEQLKKEILKSIQSNKEEKNMLKKIIEKTALTEQTNEDNNMMIHDDNDDDDDDNMSEDTDEISSKDHDNMNYSDKCSNDNIKNDDDLYDKKRKKKIYDEFEKRNLLRFSFVKNAEENKRNDEIYNRRKDILKKLENRNKKNMDNTYEDNNNNNKYNVDEDNNNKYNVDEDNNNKYNVDEDNNNKYNVDEDNNNKYNVDEDNNNKYNVDEDNNNKYNVDEDNNNKYNVDEDNNNKYNVDEDNNNKYNVDEDNNSLDSFSSDEIIKNDEESHILFSNNKLSDYSHKELSKAKKELKNDIDFVNSLKKTDILHIDDVEDITDVISGYDEEDNEKNGNVNNDNVNNDNVNNDNVNNDNVNNDNINNDNINNDNVNNDNVNNDKEMKLLDDITSADTNVSPNEHLKGDVKDKEDIEVGSKTKKKKSQSNNTTSSSSSNNWNNNLDGEGDKEKKNKTKVIENNLKTINEVNNEHILESYCKNINVYNFENNTYEDYINPKNDDIKEDEELYELSEDEKIKDIEVNKKEWCNYNTLLELEKNKMIKEKEIIETKKNKPLHTITLHNKKDKKFDKYYVDKIPYPYDKNGYEKTLNININKEINDLSAYKQLIAPQYSNKVGNVISPLIKNPFDLANIFTLKRKNQKSKL
ncbi:U3 small nucleolar RNA-associated protein 14 [Plasmodium falciparum NF54]|uniref:U3 small nucleolar RNA-associated protein 14 n=1 Tax=Plasmodium falciparum (isolate NF54) TaxID=5843 RepID=A0A8S9VNM0_PLAFO|nr:U3 small nucleolar RNA-associated protein 14 [Plasmodium falciparum NF54]